MEDGKSTIPERNNGRNHGHINKKSRDYVCRTGRKNGRNGAEPDRVLYTL